MVVDVPEQLGEELMEQPLGAKRPELNQRRISELDVAGQREQLQFDQRPERIRPEDMNQAQVRRR